MPGTLLQATFATGGSITVNDDVAVAAITALTAQLTTLNARIGLPAAPGTLSALSAVQAASLNDMATLMASVVDQQKQIVESLGIIQFALTGISTNVGQGVTTAQLAYIDQVQQNQFEQATTNAALERAELPPTEVPESKLSETIVKTVDNVSIFQLQSQVASTTTTGITFVQDQVVKGGTWLVSTGWTAAGGPTLVKAVKKFFKITDPQLKEKAAEANSVARSKLLGIPQVEAPPEP